MEIFSRLYFGHCFVGGSDSSHPSLFAIDILSMREK